MQGFWLEMTEQRSKVDAVLKSGRQVAMETHWPQGTGESLRSQYGGLEERWKKLWSEGEQWGQLLQTVHPELEKFQVQYRIILWSALQARPSKLAGSLCHECTTDMHPDCRQTNSGKNQGPISKFLVSKLGCTIVLLHCYLLYPKLYALQLLHIASL